jgi:A/G-specific adenine glycosylase
MSRTDDPYDKDRHEVEPLEPVVFRRELRRWYKANARTLPWRGARDPYRVWLSEIMLQQTRVATVIERYHEFLQRFPTLVALALAREEDVLAVWSGLGYYHRARLLHRAAQFVMQECQGKLPQTAVELRSLPGIGEYTAPAIASICFDEPVAVVDGNVERVLLRLLAMAEDKRTPAMKLLQQQATMLLDVRHPGTHNQAMMELGAMVCLPRNPHCGECPVERFCITRGEHETAPRKAMRSHEELYLLATRKKGTVTEVLMAQRSKEESLMAGMWELPQLPVDAMRRKEEVLMGIRHSITNTNYYVRVLAQRPPLLEVAQTRHGEALDWVRQTQLNTLPLTGLARKVLQRMDLLHRPPVYLPGEEQRHIE